MTRGVLLFFGSYVDAQPAWGKQLEGEVRPGVTEMTFIARSPLGNVTATCTMRIYVEGKLHRHNCSSISGLK